ncbi:MAG: cell division protein ZapA [Lutibacter sp.]|nr:cell division protein ZapA [Lutibacter sp.]
MSEPLKIKITIAGRVYPIVVKDALEEEGMRKASHKINSMVSDFEKRYAVSDKQDVLAMTALQFASLIEIKEITKEDALIEVEEKLTAIHNLLSSQLA